MSEINTPNPAIPETDDEMRALLLEAEDSMFWEEEPADEDDDSPTMPPSPFFGMFPGMMGAFGQQILQEKETSDDTDEE